MAITYSLGFNPIWYIADNVGRPLGGGYLVATSSLTGKPKVVYEDATGDHPWSTSPIPNSGSGLRGILFNENGQQGPFYFSFDSSNSSDLYNLFVYDSAGNLVWTELDYLPEGSGGGGTITEFQNTSNLITNNIFWRHIPDQAPLASAALRIAPGNHSAFAQTPANFGPDILFIKGNTSATDSLTFPAFMPYGFNNLSPDVQPPEYLLYNCTGAGSSEGSKYIQFPIDQNVANLSGVPVTFKIWANGFSGTTVITPTWAQFFGDGTNSPTAANIVTFPLGPIAITPGWNPYVLTATIPAINAISPPVVVGNCHNDGLFFQLGLPVNATCSIGLIKPSIYLGTISTSGLNQSIDFVSHDEIDAVTCSPRTGHLVYGLDAAPPLGYLAMNDTSIGSSGSGATTAGDYTFPLYNLIWNATNSPSFAQAYAPVTGGRGTSAINDFGAGKPMQLLYSLGAVIGNVGRPNATVYLNPTGTYALGQPLGGDNVILNVTQMPAHTHTYNSISFTNLPNVAAGSGFTPGSFNSGTTGGAGSGTGGGSGATANPTNVLQPTLRFNLFIKL